MSHTSPQGARNVRTSTSELVKSQLFGICRHFHCYYYFPKLFILFSSSMNSPSMGSAGVSRDAADTTAKLLDYVGPEVDVLKSQDRRHDHLRHGLKHNEFNRNPSARVSWRPGGR